jgi:hypothetical protein
VLLAAAVAAAAAGCGAPGAGGEWEPAAVRAVARRVQAGHAEREVRVLHTIGTPAGAELPWSVRQALATGGVEVAGTVEGTGVLLLVFEGSRRDGADWLVDVRLEDAPAAPPAGAVPTATTATTALTWRVRCGNGACEATDSVVRMNGE